MAQQKEIRNETEIETWWDPRRLPKQENALWRIKGVCQVPYGRLAGRHAPAGRGDVFQREFRKQLGWSMLSHHRNYRTGSREHVSGGVGAPVRPCGVHRGASVDGAGRL